MNTEYTAADAHAAVERGAAWLDEHCADWFKEIDLSQLNLSDPEVCVLGQTARCLLDEEPTFDRYGKVLDFYAENTTRDRVGGSRQKWASSRGFDIEYADVKQWRLGMHPARYEMLTIAWRLYIQERLGVAQ